MSIKFHREVTPEKPKPDQPRTVYTIIEHDSGEIMLPPDEVALLRKMLSTWNENELLPRTQYITLVELEENGKTVFVSEWKPEHDG